MKGIGETVAGWAQSIGDGIMGGLDLASKVVDDVTPDDVDVPVGGGDVAPPVPDAPALLLDADVVEHAALIVDVAGLLG